MNNYKALCEELRNENMSCSICHRQAACAGKPGCLIWLEAADAIDSLVATLESNERRVDDLIKFIATARGNLS